MTALLAWILAAVMQSLPAEALSGKTLTVPADTPTATAIFVITFQREARSQASEWTTELRKAFPSDQVTIYEVAVLEDVPSFARSFIVSGIRRSIPAPMHGNFLIVSKDAAAWQKAAAVSDRLSETYVLVTTQKGDILWRAHGKFARPQLAELASALAQHHK